MLQHVVIEILLSETDLQCQHRLGSKAVSLSHAASSGCLLLLASRQLFVIRSIRLHINRRNDRWGSRRCEFYPHWNMLVDEDKRRQTIQSNTGWHLKPKTFAKFCICTWGMDFFFCTKVRWERTNVCWCSALSSIVCGLMQQQRSQKATVRIKLAVKRDKKLEKGETLVCHRSHTVTNWVRGGGWGGYWRGYRSVEITLSCRFCECTQMQCLRVCQRLLWEGGKERRREFKSQCNESFKPTVREGRMVGVKSLRWGCQVILMLYLLNCTYFVKDGHWIRGRGVCFVFLLMCYGAPRNFSGNMSGTIILKCWKV